MLPETTRIRHCWSPDIRDICQIFKTIGILTCPPVKAPLLFIITSAASDVPEVLGILGDLGVDEIVGTFGL